MKLLLDSDRGEARERRRLEGGDPFLQPQGVGIDVVVNARKTVERRLLKVLLDIAVKDGPAESLTVGLLREGASQCDALLLRIPIPALQRRRRNTSRNRDLYPLLRCSSVLKAEQEPVTAGGRGLAQVTLQCRADPRSRVLHNSSPGPQGIAGTDSVLLVGDLGRCLTLGVTGKTAHNSRAVEFVEEH